MIAPAYHPNLLDVSTKDVSMAMNASSILRAIST
ncbi:MAG: hypothetical protein ACI9WU_001546 [Myxococcota bacterium]|jgi:hypothetical protein